MGYHSEIRTFGDVAAEQDDTILSYFLRTEAVGKIESGQIIVVLGRKGSGKTALAKYFDSEEVSIKSESLSLRDYPWNVHSERVNTGASENEAYVSSWRYLIAVKALSLIISTTEGVKNTAAGKAACKYLIDNYGGVEPKLQDILKPRRLQLSKASFTPSVMGNSLGGVEFDSDGKMPPELDALTDLLIDCSLQIASYAGVPRILLHFDELDQGLSVLNEQHERMIVGLILACRSVRQKNSINAEICPVAYLRTDLWDEFRFSDKNKISQSSSIILEWNADSLLDLVNHRIRFKIGNEYCWDDIEDSQLMRGSQTKWNHIIARTFLRPRDVIQFLNCAIEISISRDPDSDVFDNEDIIEARAAYSRYLKQELDDELGPHWDKWTEALQSCSELVTITFSRGDFVEAYDRRRSRKNTIDADDALSLLYQFSVIGYRRGIGKGGSGWVFQYSDPHAGWDNGATKLKVHLGLKEFAKLREERGSIE